MRVLEGEQAADPVAREGFVRAAQLLAQLTHPNVAPAVLETCADDPVPYLALGADPGQPLDGLGPRSPLARQCEGLYPNRRLAHAMLDAARGLAAVHSAGLRHGNLRPEAIRLHPNGVVLLTGLGEDDAPRPEARPFAPPPDAAGDAQQVDLFALGASFYALVTGAPPGPDPPPAKSLNPGVARNVSDILGRCLAADPVRRYFTANALVTDLEEVLRAEVVCAPWERRGAWLAETIAVGIGGALLLLVALIAVAFAIPGSVPRELDPKYRPYVFLALATPGLLYCLLTEAFWGRTLVRRRQRFEIADRAGDPVTHARRLARTAVKFGVIVGWGVASVSFFAEVVVLGPQAIVPGAVLFVLPLLAFLYIPFVLLFQYRLLLGECLTREEIASMAQLQPHDRLTGTRLVVRQPAEVPPVPAPAVTAAESLGGLALDRVGPYDVGSRLGGGGMGQVYRAWDRTLGRPAALKFLGDHLQTDARARERFEREARLAAQLSHPNVARVYEVGEADGRPYIAQELIAGETLAQRVVRRGPLPVSEAWRYVLQAAEALRAADRLGIVHRDIKPGNLMVTPDGTVKVTDFGLSRQVESDVNVTRTGGVVGTPMDMAPEQARGQPVDRRADMYSLGLTLYYLLAGRAAYTAKNPMDLLARQLVGPPPTLVGQIPGVTDEQQAVLARLVAPRKEDRYDDYDDLLEALRTESPDRAPVVPPFVRRHEAGLHLVWCGALLFYLYLLARWAFPAAFPVPLDLGDIVAVIRSPALLLTWQLLVTVGTVLIVVYRPPQRPFRLDGSRSVRELGRIAGNFLYMSVMFALFLWPTWHRSEGLRVVRRTTGRRVGIGRAALRFALTYPLLLPWAALAYLPDVSVADVAVPVACVHLGLFVASAVVARRDPERRPLGDVVAGTRMVRVQSPALTLLPRGVKRPLLDRIVRAAVNLSFTVLILVGIWLGCQHLLSVARESYPAVLERRERAERERLERRMREFRVTLDRYREQELTRGCDPTAVRLAVLGSAYRSVATTLRRPPQGPDDLRILLDPDGFRSARTGEEFVVRWGTALSLEQDEDAGKLLAFEPTPDKNGRRHALMGDGTPKVVTEREFRGLLPVGQP